MVQFGALLLISPALDLRQFGARPISHEIAVAPFPAAAEISLSYCDTRRTLRVRRI